MTDKELSISDATLIARLRDAKLTWGDRWASADRIEALLQAVQHANDHADAAIKDMEALVQDKRYIIDERDRTFALMLERTEAAEARADYTARILAALTPNPVDDRKQTDAAIKLAALPQERQDKIKSEADRLAALDDLARLGQEFDAAAIREGDYFEGIEEGIKIGREAALREAADVARHYAETDYCAMGYPEDGGIAASGTAHTIEMNIFALIQKGAADDQ